VIAAQRRHHRAAAEAGRKDRLRHRVPDLEERHGPGRDRARAPGPRPARPQRGEVVADAAALLHRQRALLEGLEDAVERVLDRPHDEAVEQRHAAIEPGAGEDPASRKEPSALEDALEARRPTPSILLDGRDRARDARPRVLDARLARRAVLRRPDREPDRRRRPELAVGLATLDLALHGRT
jgi:hypothetical protein